MLTESEIQNLNKIARDEMHGLFKNYDVDELFEKLKVPPELFAYLILTLIMIFPPSENVRVVAKSSSY